METECGTKAKKEALARRLDRIRQLLTLDGSYLIDNGTLLNALFDNVEQVTEHGPSVVSTMNLCLSMLRNSGKHVVNGIEFSHHCSILQKTLCPTTQ